MSETKCYKPHEFADLIGVSVKTLQRWDKEGKLSAQRTVSNHRYYIHDQYLAYRGIEAEKPVKSIVIYARVSSRGQLDDLQNQIEFLKQFCNARGMIVDECLTDIGSGLNYNRYNWNKLLDEVMTGKIDNIVIAHKDRFIRFGFDWFERFCNRFGTQITVVNNDKLSPDKELVNDIISILHVFSDRLCGLRKYKTQIKEDTEIVKSVQNRD